MLGRFLEISVHAPQIRESLEFYESLGLVQAPVGEIWPHSYAVVTDGRLYLGLHGEELGATGTPELTFVTPGIARAVATLESGGVGADTAALGDDVFNQATFRDPAGQPLRLLEARTFSPASATAACACGYFVEYGMPVRELAAAREFWERFGFIALEERADPFPRTTLTSDLLNLALYRTRALREPTLTFEAADMAERLGKLRERGFTLGDDMPDSLDDSANAVLRAPEGTRLLLLQSED